MTDLSVQNQISLPEKLARIDEKYATLGDIGQRFLSEFNAAGCLHAYDDQLACVAALNLHHRLEGFQNRIVFGNGAMTCDEQLFRSKTHESIHAIQFNKAAILHANLYNATAGIVISPRDSIRLMEMKERDAFLKELIFHWQCFPDEIEFSAEDLLRTHRRTILESSFCTDKETRRQYYRDLALSNYEIMVKFRTDDNSLSNLTYATADAQSLIEIGDNVGLPTFGTDPEFISNWALRGLSPAQEARIQTLNRILGITDEASLPSFDVALANSGQDRASFLRSSRASKGLCPA